MRDEAKRRSGRGRPVAATLRRSWFGGILLFVFGVGCTGSTTDVYSKAEILQIISEESPVYYRDGTTRLGVFFAQEHRDYVTFDRIPQACVNAIVASEDDDFFRHNGVDWKGILRAAWVNVKARRVVEGGSTLTQQTAKNLFYRSDRSFQSKLSELLAARKLERSFSKQEILEFYLNQFHVSGNGRGIGIAARYFFDKDVSALSVHECAFMAGMVKSPARYNPWTGRTEQARKEARDRARERVGYVVRRMFEEGYVDQAERDALVGREVPFKRGTFRYERSVVLDAVEAALQQPPLADLLAEAGLDQAGYDGLHIVTTLDEATQVAAAYGLWHHLTEVGPVLEGLDAAAFRLPDDTLLTEDVEVRPRQFLVGRVSRVKSGKGTHSLTVEVGGVQCVVDEAGVRRAAAVVARSRAKNHLVEPKASDLDALVTALPVGAVVRISVRPSENPIPTCDLEARPRLQGAVTVLDRGEILAMVGGNDNQNFNRVTQSVRQFGSTWKPLVYAAALRAGWLPSDVLDNRRAGFPFEGSWYWPRPDHVPSPRVSLGWAGTRSENLATIWLLFHLVDRLTDDQFRSLAARVDLAQREGEDGKAWAERIRDRWGILPSEARIEEGIFEAARNEVAASLAEGPFASDEVELRSLLHGNGLEGERRKVQAEKASADRTARLAALDRNFERMEGRATTCLAQARALEEALAGGDPGDLGQLWYRETTGRVLCAEKALAEGDVAIADLVADGLSPLASGIQGQGWRAVWVDGVLHLGTILDVRERMVARAALLEGRDPWDPEVVYLLPDFRRLVGLRYVAHLARLLGVQAELPPALSLPLGAAEISLLDIATMYQGFLEQRVFRFPGQWFGEGEVLGFRTAREVPPVPGAALLIREIRDPTGNVIYKTRSESEPVGDAASDRMVLDILRNVVRWGTGRRARSTIRVGELEWPLMGKTGTTNDYKNAAFVGYAPVAEQGSLDVARGVTVAAYVGYDDNTPMRRGSLRLAGASGALPAWMGTVEGMYAAGRLGRVGSDTVSPDGVTPEGFERVVVDEDAGLPLGVGEHADDAPRILTRPAGPGGRGYPLLGSLSIPSTPAVDGVVPEAEGEAPAGGEPEAGDGGGEQVVPVESSPETPRPGPADPAGGATDTGLKPGVPEARKGAGDAAGDGPDVGGQDGPRKGWLRKRREREPGP